MISFFVIFLLFTQFSWVSFASKHSHTLHKPSKSSIKLKNVQNFTTMRFIKLALNAEPKWMDLNEINKHLQNHKQQGYFDMTGLQIVPRQKSKWLLQSVSENESNVPNVIRFKDKVLELISVIQPDFMKSFLFNFTTTFVNRLASSPHGELASKWLLDQISQISNSSSVPLTIFKWKSKKDSKVPWLNRQYSIIVRIEGSDPNENVKKELIIIGANIDSINRHQSQKKTPNCKDYFTCPEMIAPGADDNASGSAVLLEVLRILSNDATFVPKRTLEFHWYAASEFGLRGGLTLASSYKSKNVNVIGMLCLSQVGYSLPSFLYEPFHPSMKESLRIAIHPTETDSNLNKFLKLLVDQYLEIGWIDKIFCIGCYADYAAWTEYNFPAAFLYGWEYSPGNHRGSDVYETINFQYLTEFAKLAVAYLVELGEPL